MSKRVQKARALNKLVQEDEQFGEMFIAALKSGDMDAVVRLASDAGIDLSADDFSLPRKKQSRCQPLNDDDLQSVAGGVGVFGIESICGLPVAALGTLEDGAFWPNRE